MNLHLTKIEPFCATDTQKELLKKIKKIQKFRIRRFSDSYLLEGLLFSFYVEEKFEPVMLYYDEIISLHFLYQSAMYPSAKRGDFRALRRGFAP